MHRILTAVLAIGALVLLSCGRSSIEHKTGSSMMIDGGTMNRTIEALQERFPDAKARAELGVRQVARYWTAADGDTAAFHAFCLEQFASDSAASDQLFARFERNLILIDGYLTELGRDLAEPLQLDRGPILPVDHLFGTFSPGVHASDDYFATRLAFVALLNFPVTTLQERLSKGAVWSRRQWAEARLAQRFAVRVPADAAQQATAAYTAADAYISEYNIHMHQVLDASGQRLFPDGLKLISHWGLRDELKAQYANMDGLPRQRAIMTIMEHIIDQSIPAVVIDNSAAVWDLRTNTVISETSSKPITSQREQDTRYKHWLSIFQAERGLDRYYPDTPTYIQRKFEREREIPEQTVEQLFVSVLRSPEVKRTAALIARRLGRPLEPFDIWYSGFKPRPAVTEQDLDKVTARRYPSAAAFQIAIPGILAGLGFDAKMAGTLAARITVDPSRGAGHAMGAGRLNDNAHLRTRVPAGGMNYKGYNIAVHELGHNVEQVLSFQLIDQPLLRGVPNTAFTEAFAFVFQSRDLSLLGVKAAVADADELQTLDTFWATYEICGVAITDMRVWRWLYAHPDATPDQLRAAVTTIAQEVWNEFYAPVMGARDVTLLAIYSHMIDAGMYTPDYPLGHIIAFQIEQYLKDRKLATEMQRMCAMGSVSPDLWMRNAVGSAISTRPMLEAAASALSKLGS